jgi:probable F420-dependent oxidoreductase
MRFGLSLFTCDRGITPAEAARAAEDRGLDSFYVPEHTHIPISRDTAHPATGDETLPDDRYRRTLDPWVALATAASVTSRIRLGTSVCLPAEHDPIALAKTIATLDHLSGGRVQLGVGFGWNLEELADHGVPVARRRAYLADVLAAMQALWTSEEAAYEGEFVRFGAAWAWPKPVQQPRPPVLVGAFGNAKAFQWIARHADGWITTPLDEGIAELAALLRTTWAEAGRAGEPQVIALETTAGERLDEFAAAGVTEVLVSLPDVGRDDALRHLDQLVARIDEHRGAVTA